MRVIVPVEITGGRLLSSNVPDDDYSEWSPSDTYTSTPGETPPVVRVGVDIYALQKESSLNENPAQFPDVWGHVGVINRWRMFDPLRGADIRTTNPGSIVVTVKPGERVNSLALFGLQATEVLVELFDDNDNLIYSELQQTFSKKGIKNWADYFRGRFSRVTRLSFLTMPSNTDGYLRITITNGGSQVGVGKLAIGNTRELGCAMFGLNARRKNHSVQDRDAFGGLFLVPRRTVKTINYTVKLPSQNLDFVDVTLSQFYGRPTVYIGSGRWSFSMIYGILIDANPSLDGNTESTFTMQVEEI